MNSKTVLCVILNYIVVGNTYYIGKRMCMCIDNICTLNDVPILCVNLSVRACVLLYANTTDRCSFVSSLLMDEPAVYTL